MLIDYLSKRKLEPVARLIKKYNKGTLTENEQMTLHEWIAQSQENLDLFIDFGSPKIKEEELADISKLKEESINKIMAKINLNNPRNKM